MRNFKRFAAVFTVLAVLLSFAACSVSPGSQSRESAAPVTQEPEITDAPATEEATEPVTPEPTAEPTASLEEEIIGRFYLTDVATPEHPEGIDYWNIERSLKYHLAEFTDVEMGIGSFDLLYHIYGLCCLGGEEPSKVSPCENYTLDFSADHTGAAGIGWINQDYHEEEPFTWEASGDTVTVSFHDYVFPDEVTSYDLKYVNGVLYCEGFLHFGQPDRSVLFDNNISSVYTREPITYHTGSVVAGTYRSGDIRMSLYSNGVVKIENGSGMDSAGIWWPFEDNAVKIYVMYYNYTEFVYSDNTLTGDCDGEQVVFTRGY